MKRVLTSVLALLLCACLLGGCAKKTEDAPASTIAPGRDPYEAPLGDQGGDYEMLATLYLPSADGTQLAAVTEALRFSSARSQAETVLGALLEHNKGEDYTAVPGHGKVSLSGPEAVTWSCGIVSVNLSVAALSLPHAELFTLCQAIANTLCALDGVTGVNVLVAGVSPGLDVAATLPMGCLRQNVLDDPNMLHSRLTSQRRGGASGDTPFRADAALYFPAQAGRGILCEARTLTFPSADAAAMVQTLLSGLSAGAEEIPNVPDMPDLNALLSRPPMVDEVQVTGQKQVALAFKEELNDALAARGVTRSVMIASLVTTLTTFLPNVSVCRVSIGSEQITALIPAGLYEGAGRQIGFSDGEMRRTDFLSFLLTNRALYFADASGALRQSVRALPRTWALSPRQLFDQLVKGPEYYDTVADLKTVFPPDIQDADLLGVRQTGDTLLLNLSDSFMNACQGLSPQQERNLVYALVNTLTENPSIRRVRFYIQGRQPDTLSGTISLPGEFLR